MTRIRPARQGRTWATSRMLAAGLLAAGVSAVAPVAASADEGDPAPVPAPRFLPGSSFGGFEVRQVHVGGTVHLTDVDPFFDEDDHCDLGVDLDLLLTVAAGPGSLGHVEQSGDCDGGHARLTVTASVDGTGDVTVSVQQTLEGDANFPIPFDPADFDELHDEAGRTVPVGSSVDVHLDAGGNTEVRGTADLTVSVS